MNGWLKVRSPAFRRQSLIVRLRVCSSGVFLLLHTAFRGHSARFRQEVDRMIPEQSTLHPEVLARQRAHELCDALKEALFKDPRCHELMTTSQMERLLVEYAYRGPDIRYKNPVSAKEKITRSDKNSS
ncbi:hypothetical protein O0L34_g348 [Tuta absoluta]|nr:hypothetical protein O0L34_g348 [Tuta absoluta]